MTLSSDENHNGLMVRLVRLRQKVPAYKFSREEEQKCYARLWPPLQNWEGLPVDATPSYDTRPAVLTNSAVSAADGFKIHARFAFKYIYGMRLCLNCPGCSCSDDGTNFRADAEGLCTEIQGGALGRPLTIAGTSEFQKKRDEHLHYQLFVQCAHTSLPLQSVQALAAANPELTPALKHYVDNACFKGSNLSMCLCSFFRHTILYFV
jgi:hypothetical protein